MLLLYNVLYIYLCLLTAPVIISIILSSQKRRKTSIYRLGLYGHHVHLKNTNRPLWIHALSVGEVISAVPLVKKIKQCLKDKDIIFSTTTTTGFEIANRLLKDDLNSIFFFPHDFFFSVKHVAKLAEPSAVIIVESDIWPNFLFEMKHRNIPVFWVNARLSQKSFLGYKMIMFFTKKVFSSFAKICAQSEEDAGHFRMLNKNFNGVAVTGNLKFDQTHEPVSTGELESIRKSFNIGQKQKVLVAGSTHKGEEELLLNIFIRLKKSFNDLVFIITPRDPKRSEYVCKLYKSAGFTADLMTKAIKTSSGIRPDVIIIDKIGVLKKIYALADVAFIGGSFAKRGGHNPLEPAAYSRPVIFGPDMSNFSEIADLLLKSKGALQVKDEKEFYKAVLLLLGNRKNSEQTGKNAFEVFYSNKGAVEKTLREIISFPW